MAFARARLDHWSAPRAASYRRRLRLAGDVQYATSRMLAPPKACRLVEVLIQSLIDTVESVRTGHVVPGFARPAPAAISIPGLIAQHPRYRTYWHDADYTVGMHVGVDFIRHGGLLFPIEINLNAAVRPERRALYAEELDPWIQHACETAIDLGRKRVVFFAWSWTAAQIAEFQAASRRYGLGIVAAAFATVRHGAVRALAVDRDPDALVVVHHYQHTPLDTFTTNKAASSCWLRNAGPPLGVVLTSAKPFVPRPADRWPNLVVKLSGGWSGYAVKMLRVRDENHARACLHGAFRQSPIARLRSAVGRHQQIIYQEFVPPEVRAGHAEILRAHVLLTPVTDRLLSVHRVVSNHPVPSVAPWGLIRDARPYVVNFSQGARYVTADDVCGEVERAVISLGALARNAITSKFLCGPRTDA